MVTVTVIGNGDKYLEEIFRDFSSPMVDAMSVTESSEVEIRGGPVKFTADNAREMARRSAEVRRAKADARKMSKAIERSGPAVALDSLIVSQDRERLGPAASAFAQWLMAEALAGRIVVHGKDLAPLLKTLVDIARLEAGEATSHTAVAHVSATADQVLGQIQQMARDTSSSG